MTKYTPNNTRNYERNNDFIGLTDYEADSDFAWNRPDTGLWCFGAVYSGDDGVILVLDPVRDPLNCISRTKAIANPLQECVMISGQRIRSPESGR